MSGKKNNNTNQNESSKQQWISTLIVNIISVTYGLQAGWTSPITKLLQSENSPTGSAVSVTVLSIIASIFCLSAVLGVYMFGYIADRYGRKVGIITLCVPQAISWLLKFLWPSETGLIIARVCCGLSGGGTFNVIPIYVKEIARPDIRGVLGAVMMVTSNAGMLIMFLVGGYLDYFTVLKTVIWIPFLNMFLLFLVPESPQFLVKVGKLEEAAKTLASLRGLDTDHKTIIGEIEHMKNEEEYFQSLPKITFLSIFRNSTWRRCYTIAVTVMAIHASHGSFAITVFASVVLSVTGSSIDPKLMALAFPILVTFGSVISLFVIQKLPRRILLTGAHVVTVTAYLTLGTLTLLNSNGISTPSWLAIASAGLVVTMYGLAELPVPYIVLSEMFNFQIRMKAVGSIVMLVWFLAFVQLSGFMFISTMLGMHTSFFYFAVVNVLGIVFNLTVLPETKGKSVEEIEQMLRKRT